MNFRVLQKEEGGTGDEESEELTKEELGFSISNYT